MMAGTPSFFAKLFKGRFWRHKKKTAAPAPDGSTPPARPRLENHTEKPLKLAERQRPADRPEPDPYLLSFPMEHAMHQLWRLRRDEKGWLPSPEFTLHTGEDQVLTPLEARKEAPRLTATLSAAAQTRLAAATPKPQPGQEPEEPPPPISLDAQAVIYVASNGLSAWLSLFPPVGEGQELSQEELLRSLSAAGVTYGVDTQRLALLPSLESRYFHLFPIALGRAAVPGKDGAVIDLFPREATRKLPVDEYNRVDFAAATSTQNVEKGQAICRISPPTPGVPGRMVTDKEIPTRDGIPAVAPMGRNTALSEDGATLIATQTGGLEFAGRAFQVNPLLEISGNVDHSTGSVNFLGDVHIHGDVCSGFTVRAMGNIKVDGVVESSTIEAGGDLVLTKGVQGNNQAVIRAHRDIYAKFLENCSVHVQENLHSECIIGCEVFSDAAVYAQSGRGAIIGGRVRAAREVAANIVGSKTEVRTSIYVGGLPVEDFEKELLTQEITDLEKKLAETERQPSSPTKLSRMSKMRMQISVNRLKLNQYMKNLEALDGQDPDKRMGGRLTFGIAYPGTRIHMGDSLLKVPVETRHSMAMLIEGEVRLMS